MAFPAIRNIPKRILANASILALVVLFSCLDENPLPSNPCHSNFVFGYTDKVSYFPGDRVKVFMQASADVPLCRLDVYSVKGDIIFSAAANLNVQVVNPDKPYTNGFGFQVFSEVEIPMNLKSGIYQIENSIPFVVKSFSPAQVLVVYASNTANAYEKSGGRNMYEPASGPPTTDSFHRPIKLQAFAAHGLKFFSTLINLNIGYIADVDLDEYSHLHGSKIIVLAGHSEYWTRLARLNFDKFIDGGGHGVILSGNTMWWQARYTPDGSGLVCFRYATLDPESDPLLKTITWDEPSLGLPILQSIGADFNHGGYGLRNDKGWNGLKIINAGSPLLEATSLYNGALLSLPSEEYDGAPVTLDANGWPVVNNDKLKFHKVELIGFDRGFRGGDTYGTFIVFQRTATSGIIVNTATTDWCSANGMGGTSGEQLKKITLNAIEKLLNGQAVFSK